MPSVWCRTEPPSRRQAITCGNNDEANARRAVHAAVCRVASQSLPYSLLRLLGSIRASSGDAERAPSREKFVVVPIVRCGPRRTRANCFVDARAHRAARAAVHRVASPRLSCSSDRRLSSVRACAGDAEPAPSRERVVVPTERRRPRRARADRFVDARAPRAARAAVRRVTSLCLSSSSHRRLGSVRASAGDADPASSSERVVVPT